MAKFFLSIAISGLLLIANISSYASDLTDTSEDLTDTSEVNSYVGNYRYRTFNREVFNSLYSFVPSTMNLWGGESWSQMEAGLEYNERNFKSTQMFSRENLIGFNTESIQQIDTLDVTFYGKFLYNTTRAYDAGYNLFYKNKETGSPFYLFTPATGKWQTQTYMIKGGASKSFFKRKVHIGAIISYTGDMFNRVLDTRNSKIDLNTEIFPSITYHISKNQTISLGLNYRRNKKEPRLSNYFPRSGDDTDYWIYINKGMGTYENINIGYSVFAVSHSFDYNANWILETDKFTVSAYASYLKGSEKWQTKFSKPNTAEYFEVAKYDWNKKFAGASLYSKFHSFFNLSSIDFELIDGLGFTYNEPGQVYQKSYSFDNMQINLSSDFIFNRDFLNKLGAAFLFEKNDRLDLNYAQKSSFTNLHSTLKIGAVKMPLLKGDLFLDFDVMHNFNLTNSHNPMSAGSNMYTVNILKPYLRYRTTDYVAFSPILNWEKSVSKRFSVGVELSGILLNPYKENYILNNSVTTGESSSVAASEYGANKGFDLKLRLIF